MPSYLETASNHPHTLDTSPGAPPHSPMLFSSRKLAASSSFLSHMRYASMHSLRSKPRPWVHNNRGLEGGAGQGLQGVMMMLYTHRIGFVTNPWEGGGLATIKQCKEVKPQSLKPGMCCPRPLPAASPPPQPLIPPPLLQLPPSASLGQPPHAATPPRPPSQGACPL